MTMTSGAAINRLDLSMSYGEFDMFANQQNMICTRVLPPIAVPKDSGSFSKISIAQAMKKPTSTARAPSAAYQRGGSGFTTDSYTTQEHGWEEPVDHQTSATYADVINSEAWAVENSVNQLLQWMEKETADMVFNATTWTGSGLTTALGTPWSTKASADPVADMDAGRKKVQDGCGQQPNTLICSEHAFTCLIRTDRIESLLKGNSAAYQALQEAQSQPGIAENPVFMGALCELLRIKQILIGRATYNNADEGQAVSMLPYWSNTMAMLAVIRDDGIDGNLASPKPQLGRTLFWAPNNASIPGVDPSSLRSSLIFEEYIENHVRSTVYRCRNQRQAKIFHPQCGHLLTAVTA
jgi:hypothetical protein